MNQMEMGVASGELIRKLFQSHQRRDDEAFAHFARQIVVEERQKNHNLLADDLERILDNRPRRTAHFPSTTARRLQELPKDRERDAQLVDEVVPTRSLDDLVLNETSRGQLEDVVRENHRSELLAAYGLRPRRRVFFYGPPGCGKTVAAEAIAFELQRRLIIIRLDAVVSSYLGETASNLRKVFDLSAANECAVFFDDFDAIGKRRSNSDEHSELKRVVNSFLQMLDSIESENFVIAATNHGELIDPALLRRFDEVIYFGLPEIPEIIDLLGLRLSSVRHSRVDLWSIAEKLVGGSHSDVERVCLDAKRLMVLQGEDELTNAIMHSAVGTFLARMDIIREFQLIQDSSPIGARNDAATFSTNSEAASAS